MRFSKGTKRCASGALVGTYSGLSSPYTYSDMTGWALQNAACTPEG